MILYKLREIISNENFTLANRNWKKKVVKQYEYDIQHREIKRERDSGRINNNKLLFGGLHSSLNCNLGFNALRISKNAYNNSGI